MVVEVAASFVAEKAIEKSATALTEKLSLRFAKNKYDELMILLNKGLPRYLEANYSKCETIKTLLNRNHPRVLDDCFVAPNFKSGKNAIAADDLLDRINSEAQKVVITGLAGSGKSVFVKHSFRRVIEKGHSYYPLFLELRTLNRIVPKKGMLLSEIYDSIKSSCPEFTRAQFNFGLRSGAFYILLDGFDEVTQEIRDQVAEDICAISRDFFKCALVVSSRPSDDFVSWEGFSESRLLPFDLTQAVEYIEKLEFDEEKKSDFVEDLKSGLFEKNKEFLSNPLLAAMMLLTYDSFGEIPERRHIFYAKCFDVLAREHDASKGRYKRKLFSKLTMEQLEKAFMFFCALSYADRALSFSQPQMCDYVSLALEACGFEDNVDDVIRDFRESISIMELDGMTYEFAHRSFQEYFYAKFVVSDRKIPLADKIGQLTKSFIVDDTVDMIAEMDRAYFEDEYLLKVASALNKKISNINAAENPAGILGKFYDSMVADSLSTEEGEQNKRGIYWGVRNSENCFIWRQSIKTYEAAVEPYLEQPLVSERIERDKQVEILDRVYGAEIKIHHANNKKLLEVGADVHARRIQNSISALCCHLVAVREKRNSGLGALLRTRYINS